MTIQNGGTRYDQHQDVWDGQHISALYIAPSVSKYLVFTPPFRLTRDGEIIFVGCSIRDRCLTKRRQMTDERTYLHAIIRRSAYFVDHCQHRADGSDPPGRKVYSHNTNRKSRLVFTTEVLGMVTVVRSWINTFCTRTWREESLDVSEWRQ